MLIITIIIITAYQVINYKIFKKKKKKNKKIIASL
jgi:cytochrome bd-type quinol oxidase subunit 2